MFSKYSSSIDSEYDASLHSLTFFKTLAKYIQCKFNYFRFTNESGAKRTTKLLC